MTTTPEPSTNTTYVLYDALKHAEERLAAGAEWLDRWTVSRLGLVGVPSGCRCPEVGAGGGSIAHWLSDQVGQNGRVLVIDMPLRDAHRIPDSRCYSSHK